MKRKILAFQNEYRWLSNFWYAPFILSGKNWPTVEHWYQAMKSTDKRIQEYVRKLSTPGKTKRYGKSIALRPDWEWVKLSIMYNGVYAKFDQNKELRKKLIDTGDMHLEEGNRWGDTYWGVYSGKGRNILGRILMDVRRQL